MKPLIVFAAVVGTLTASAVAHRFVTRKPPLFGLYEVDEFARNGVVAGPTDGSRWRRVAFDRGGVVFVRRGDESSQYFRATVDTSKHVIVLQQSGDATRMTYSFESSGDTLRLRSEESTGAVTATLRRVDPEKVFPLLRHR